ncbi:MAG: hypothetical protein PHQ04_03040 [Opitutaceae bacterium]|nr:hypothetical protein [Opitutaceae bacterium]
MKRLIFTSTCGLLLALSFAPALRAQGGSPMLTDDTGTPGAGKWELTTAFTTERRSGERVSELPAMEIKYGLGKRIELAYGLSYLGKSVDGEPRTTGLGNSVAGMKWRFYDAGEDGLLASVTPELEFNNPGSRSDERELVEHGTVIVLPFQVQKVFGPVDVNVDFGREFTNSDDSWFGGLCVGHAIGEKVELAAELHVATDEDVGRSALTANVGIRIAVMENSELLIALGRELHNHFEPKVTLLGYLGWNQAF